jgi:hypothetical protein
MEGALKGFLRKLTFGHPSGASAALAGKEEKMAIFHMNIKIGRRSSGQSAKAKADYILREGKYAKDRDGDRDKVLHSQSGNMPKFADDPQQYWEAADTYERANGRLFREIEFSLPVELTLNQQKELVRDFAEHVTSSEKLPHTFAIHDGKGKNPHCHLIVSERKNDGIERPAERYFKRHNAKEPGKGGARKSESLVPKSWLQETRQAWSEHANKALENAGHSARINHRSLKDQSIDRLPGIHKGPNVKAIEHRGIRMSRGELARSIEATNSNVVELKKKRDAIDKVIHEITTEQKSDHHQLLVRNIKDDEVRGKNRKVPQSILREKEAIEKIRADRQRMEKARAAQKTPSRSPGKPKIRQGFER